MSLKFCIFILKDITKWITKYIFDIFGNIKGNYFILLANLFIKILFINMQIGIKLIIPFGYKIAIRFSCNEVILIW